LRIGIFFFFALGPWHGAALSALHGGCKENWRRKPGGSSLGILEAMLRCVFVYTQPMQKLQLLPEIFFSIFFGKIVCYYLLLHCRYDMIDRLGNKISTTVFG